MNPTYSNNNDVAFQKQQESNLYSSSSSIHTRARLSHLSQCEIALLREASGWFWFHSSTRLRHLQLSTGLGQWINSSCANSIAIGINLIYMTFRLKETALLPPPLVAFEPGRKRRKTSKVRTGKVGNRSRASDTMGLTLTA